MSNSGLSASAATVIAAVVGLIGGWGSPFIEQWLKGQPPKTISEEKSQDTPPAAAASGFGTWSPLQPDVAYEAKSDGYVAAISSGNRPANGVAIYGGPSAANLDLRMRGYGAYNSALLPVRKGDYWLVRGAESSGHITVSWLPVGK
jgi:hypothetical protein